MSKSPNHYNGRGGWKPDIIVCHITEGGFQGAVAWLCDLKSQASAHFVVGADGQKEQLVDFKDGAWCNGTTTDPNSRLFYKNSINRIVKSRDTNANLYTYSIEHEGYSYKDRFGALTEKQYQASLEVMKMMITDMKNTYGVDFIADREHLIGHFHIDPKGKPACPAPNQGANFPFDRFIADIRAWQGNQSTPVTPSPDIPTTGTYTVVQGDTLTAIANRNGISLKELIAANPQISNPDLIKVGQGVNIPIKTSINHEPPKPVLKTPQEVAMEIHRGVGGWGNDPERKEKLISYGGGAFREEVKNILNEMYK